MDPSTPSLLLLEYSPSSGSSLRNRPSPAWKSSWGGVGGGVDEEKWLFGSAYCLPVSAFLIFL